MRVVVKLIFSILIPMCLFVFLVSAQSYSQSEQAKHETLIDGVERWYIPIPENGKSYLTRKFEEIYNVVFSKNAQPFGRSVAFLVGVSRYQNLSPQLPSVRNDIIQMRDLLLNQAGFDEVYVAEDDIVNRDLVEHYIKGIIPGETSKNDRLLFYYSGHGGDDQGDSGYMLFGKAQRGEFWGPQVLEVNALSTWSSELKIQHALFIVDSCSSGLAFTAKSAPDGTDNLLLQTLGGNGSRTVLTAGTADEAAYALEDRHQTGNGVFTRVLMVSFHSRRLSGAPLITVTDLFSDIEKQMAQFRVSEGKTTTPRMWRLRENDYRGTFVFLNEKVSAAQLTGEQAKALGVTSVAKAPGDLSTEVATGIIEVFSNDAGNLSIDGQEMGEILGGESRQFVRQTLGKHQVRFKKVPVLGVNSGDAQELIVEGGKIAYAAFSLKSPVDESGKVPVGTLVVQSVHELSGDVFVDGFPVGHLGKDGQLAIANLTAGPHLWRIAGQTEGLSSPVLIAPRETTYRVVLAPPSGLTATVQ
jgi:uncharacterized caspase-like protein